MSDTFQVASLFVFGVALVFGVLVFSGFIPLWSDAPPGVGGTVVVWGSVPKDIMQKPMDELNKKNEKLFRTVYLEKDAATFDRDFTEALASGKGPDLVLLPHTYLTRHEDRLIPMSYERVPLRDFRDTFVEEAVLYERQIGVIALPFSIDPLVLYWNRDLFQNEGIAQPPRYWDEFQVLAKTLSVRDKATNITRSAISFGEFRNVTHAKDIIALLMLQIGNPITELIETAGRDSTSEPSRAVKALLGSKEGTFSTNSESALRFYTEFSNPAKLSYSWNRGLPASKDFFLSGDLATYIGYASEKKDIRAKSPHLNFDLAVVPQARGIDRNTTFGILTGVSIVRASKNPISAAYAATTMTSKDFIKSYAKATGMPPARRDLLKEGVGEIRDDALYKSALISRGWYDPDPEASDGVFLRMVENVTSGRMDVIGAVGRAHQELRVLTEKEVESVEDQELNVDLRL